jgi:hypothetical protein
MKDEGFQNAGEGKRRQLLSLDSGSVQITRP